MSVTTATLGRLLVAQLHDTGRKTAQRLGVRRPTHGMDARVSPPDSAAARAAADLIREWGPPALATHSHRTFTFASLLGSRDRLIWDAEVLFVAAMLHDTGLTGHLPRDRPFQDVGAAHTRAFCNDAGWSETRATLASRAVAMHMEIGLAHRDRPEVALLHLGAALDATGLRVNDLPAPVVAEVIERFPRDDFGPLFAGLMADEARRHPRSTTAMLCRWGQLPRRIHRAPFDP